MVTPFIFVGVCMRYRVLRFDIWLCVLLAYGISYVPGYFIEKIYESKYPSYVEAHTVSSGIVGGKASEDTFRAESVSDLLAHDTFTIVSKGIQYRNEGAGYLDGQYMYAVTLSSGEKVAARINMESVVTTEDSMWSGDSILPVGKVVYTDFSNNETFLHQIGYKERLSRTDFYIDMMGSGSKMSKEDFVSVPKMYTQLVTGVICFMIIHAIGAKIGIFPYFFAPKKTYTSEWDS